RVSSSLGEYWTRGGVMRGRPPMRCSSAPCGVRRPRGPDWRLASALRVPQQEVEAPPPQAPSRHSSRVLAPCETGGRWSDSGGAHRDAALVERTVVRAVPHGRSRSAARESFALPVTAPQHPEGVRASDRAVLRVWQLYSSAPTERGPAGIDGG